MTERVDHAGTSGSATHVDERTGKELATPPPAPGLPAHRPRKTDVDPKAANRAERVVVGFFTLSALGTLLFLVAFFAVDTETIAGDALQNRVLGAAMALALFGIGAGAIHWSRTLMTGEEIVSERHPLRSDDDDRASAVAEFDENVEGSGFTRRKMIRRSLLGATGLLLVPPVVLLRDLGPLPGRKLSETLWNEGVLIVDQVTGAPIRPEDVPVGGLVNAVPENLENVPHEGSARLNALAKAAVFLVRLDPDEIRSQQGNGWDYQGIVCYSKICTHVGCPISLYEQQTHHLLCPCHQSTFDIADSANVVFGPAARSLPQLPIRTNAEGFLEAADGFAQPVGPSFWERG